MTMSDLAKGGFALVLVLLTVGVATILGLWVKDDSARGSRRRKRRWVYELSSRRRELVGNGGTEVGQRRLVAAWAPRGEAASAYAVAAQQTSDIVVAVNFARENHLRLVTKGGSHSYLGTSNAPDSLMVWTRVGSEDWSDDGFTRAT